MASGYGEIMVILAKEDETLIEHTKNTLKVLKSVKEAYPEVPSICKVDDFWDYLFYSLFFHDFGKSSIEFQRILKKESDDKFWNYRHEVLSASFIESLTFLDDEDKYIIGLGIITHHKDIKELDNRYGGFISPYTIEEFYEKKDTIKDNYDELISYFDFIPELSKLYLDKTLQKPCKIKFNDIKPVYKSLVKKYYNQYNNFIEYDEKLSKLHSLQGIFIKGFLTTCDHLASAGIYNILCTKDTFKSYDSIKDNLRTTQKIASDTEGSSFLIAPTGSGKTEAALLWAYNNQNEKLSKRVFYVLPFTASINAMYLRFCDEFGEEFVGMLHGKSSYFLYKQLSEDSYKNKKDHVRELKNLTKKIYKPYKIITPFQIIKYFFGVKGFEMGLSEMAGSLLIFDEIHAYNPRTTALILSVLKILKNDYKVNLLILSATLPSFILELFSKELNINKLISLSPDELDTYTRHKVNILKGSLFDYIEDMIEDLYDNKKVLIVCNTVNDAQKIYELIDVPNSALIHSRFILKDREEIEKKLDNLNLLVGTQAIEVSLDINYDVLYSQPAPIDALIQRFGRINRKGWEDNMIKPVNVCTIGSEYDNYIYDEEIVKKTIGNLEKVDILYESKIQELLDNVYSEGYSEDNQELFNQVTKSFEEIYNSLVPFINNSSPEFYKLFDSVEVVPYKFFEEYCQLLEEKKYYEAMAYTLNISYKQFIIQKNKNNIEEYDETLFINVDYDSEIGLQLYNSKDENETEIW